MSTKFSEIPQYETLRNFFKRFSDYNQLQWLLYLQKQTMTRQTDMAKSISGILQLFFENADTKIKEIERNSICSCLPIFAATSAFIPVVDILWRLHIHVVTSFIFYKYIMSRDSVLFYQVLRRITIKNRSSINGILHDIIFNIALTHLIPPSYAYSCHAVKRIFYKMPCHDILQSCRKGMYVVNSD